MGRGEYVDLDGQTVSRRTDRRDPRLPLGDMFDPLVARQLWESLPEECRVDHIDKKNIPDRYRGAIPLASAGGPWSTCYINFKGLPETMTWELAWLLHREIELGRFAEPNNFNTATRALRVASAHGGKRGRSAVSLLQLTPEEWVREVQSARLRGVDVGSNLDGKAVHRLKQLQDVLVYPYHRGQWWELDVWNPVLDRRVPLREHEPGSRNVVNFSRLTSPWLRDGAKRWLSACLSSGTMSWSTVRTRLDNIGWLQQHIREQGDQGPCLTADPHRLRPFVRSFCAVLSAHRISEGQRNAGQLLGKNPRRQIMTGIEQFYRWMYDHRDEAAAAHPEWASLRAEHCVLFRPEDKPRLTNKKSDDMVLEDTVVERIAQGCDLLARQTSEGGLGDIQAFHALMLLIRTGRRAHEVLMMDFDPLIPLRQNPSAAVGEHQDGAFVARMRYQQTKIESDLPVSIPVDAEIVAIVKAQQQVALDFMASIGAPGVRPKYLFLRVKANRNGDSPYSLATLHSRLGKLTQRLAITDSVGRPVQISQTHRFRHTRATNLINAEVPLHVVMRYFGHVSPEMTLHYAVTSSRTMEEEFLKYKKVSRDGRTVEIDGSDLYELIQLDKRADRVLPNGWCALPPKQSCDKGNACLACPKFVTDATHAPELRRQLADTEHLVAVRQEAFTAKYGAPMDESNIWLQGRRAEIDSLNQILLSITDVTDRAIRGAGAADRTA